VFVAQNFGAKRPERIRAGAKQAVASVACFCIAVSGAVFAFAKPLMGIFVDSASRETIAIGVGYLRIEGACYLGIGLLFLLYGYYRAVERPGMSVILTILSLGTRVVLAHVLSAIPAVGVVGIWVSIPIGWVVADVFGIWYTFSRKQI
jgi:Na+-driven multidrug efflux pump